MWGRSWGWRWALQAGQGCVPLRALLESGVLGSAGGVVGGAAGGTVPLSSVAQLDGASVQGSASGEKGGGGQREGSCW